MLAVPMASTIVDDFLENGYRVGYFSGQDESFGGDGYDVGFKRATVAYDARNDRTKRYSTATTPGSLAVPFTVLQERVDQFLREPAEVDAPLFLYVNFHDAHFPYWHEALQNITSSQRLPRRQISPGAREALWETYVNTAANVDRAVGTLLEAVRRARGAEPGVIVMADHGESLFDEGFLGHGYALNDVQTRIPLVVANLAMTVVEPFGQADLRGAIRSALRAPEAAGRQPLRRAEPDRRLFQYLGDLARPRQIAFLLDQGRLIYDFRTARVLVPGGTWVAPSELDRPWQDAFVRLIRHWEALTLARERESLPAG
jgi:hypothetical protein